MTNDTHDYEVQGGDAVGHRAAVRSTSGEDVSPSRSWRARKSSTSASPLDCPSSANETTSTATTITEPSHQDSTPPIESAMMRTRTNFGDYHFYVPPETKASPYRVPNGAPVSPQASPSSSRDRRVPQKLKLPFLPTSPEREPQEDREHITSPSPLDEKRLQFFDDAASDQVPFDQVWNQQEFILEEKKSEDGDPSYDQDHDGGDLDQSQQNEMSKPFDEERPEERAMGLPGSSAFSVYTLGASSTAAVITAAVGTPPPPPPLTWHQKQPSPRTQKHRKATSTPIHRNGDQTSDQSPHDEQYNPYGSADDIPSDEEQPKRGRKDATVSLATASKRTTAEDVGGKKAEDLSYPGSPKRDDEDEKSVDSLFDFERQKSTSQSFLPPQSPGRWMKQRPARIVASEGDATQGDNEYALNDEEEVKSLKARAQEAFATRKRHSSSPRALSPSKSSPQKGLAAVPTAEAQAASALAQMNAAPASPLPQKVIAAVPTSPRAQDEATRPPPQEESDEPAVAPAPAPRVSFGPNNTVHHFLHEYDYHSEHSESLVSASLEERSIGDVEEAIRDIFMMDSLGACNPSAQQIRYHRDTSFERRDSGFSDNDSDDDDEDDTYTFDNDKLDEELDEKLDKVPSQNEDVFFEAMLSMVEGGLGVMSAAFGFAAGETAVAGGARAGARAAASKSRGGSSPNQRDKSGEVKSPRSDENRRSSNDSSMLNSMSDFILGPAESGDPELESSGEFEPSVPQDEREYDILNARAPQAPSEDEDYNEPQSLEDDPRLLELAKQSALCMHEVLGVQYDESRGVDIGDVKFVVVVLSLPLGIIFQEDYSGCWITKIIPKGNADLNGKIEAGDQLAAINGRSSIGMKVDGICAAISDASSQANTIELTFLRYIGPFQPLQSDGASLVGSLKEETESSEPSTGMKPSLDLELEDEKPRSTISINQPFESKSKKQVNAPKSPKRLGLRKKFKWLSRGKKQQKSE